ncbi:MAG: hypothetical protein Q4A25_00775 [Candidatus Saccharibacteria bacterium]|nr:hypothetical protein [Candidatus Saccharibacteria bacterium]
MEGLVDVLVVMLASIANAGLQLGTGTLLLLYNESLGRKVKKTTRSVTCGFILGSFLLSVLLISTTMLLILLINSHPLVENGLILLSSLAIAMAVMVIGLYFRRGKNTMLWIPDFAAKYFRKRAGKVDTPVEGMALGMTTVVAELPFSVVLILIAANSLLNLPQAVIILALVGYALITVMPLIIMKLLIKNGTTLAEIQRWRVRNKTFLRIFTGICYIALAVFIIAFKLLERAQ